MNRTVQEFIWRTHPVPFLVRLPKLMPVLAGYSKLQVLLVLGYFCIWFYTISCVSNPFTDPKRSGWIAIFQLPFLFMFSAKNNILGWLVGFGYQNVRVTPGNTSCGADSYRRKVKLSSPIRRSIGHSGSQRTCHWIRYVTLHAILFGAHVEYSIVYGYFSKGIVFARLQRTSNIFGLAALGCLNVIFIFSTSFWRKKAYNTFAKIHFLCYVTALPVVSASRQRVYLSK